MPTLADVTRRQFDAIIAKRMDDVIDRYAREDDTYVFLEGPRWSTTGHARIATGWRAFAEAPLALTSVDWVEGPHYATAGELGWIAGIVDLAVRVGEQTKTVRFRGTFVMQHCADDEWRIVHEHFSQPMADPYGIGDWLPTAP